MITPDLQLLERVLGDVMLKLGSWIAGSGERLEDDG